MFRKRNQQQQQAQPLSQSQPPLPRITKPTNFPAGTAIDTERGFYFIKGITRFKFLSERVFETWSLVAIPASYDAIKHMKFGGNLGFRDGTLIHNIADGKMYLVSENKRRHIVTPDVFERYGLDRSKAILVSDEEANFQAEGEVLK